MALGFTSYGYVFFVLAAASVYYIVPRRFQNIVLAAASLAFYAVCDARYLPLIIAATLLCRGCGLVLPRAKSERGKSALLALSVLLLLTPLFACKYLGFFGDIASSLFSFNLTLKGIAMPLGISFYTFCAIGYLIDVRRGAVEPCGNLIAFICFLCFFPQMSAGPIGRAGALIPQYERPRDFKRENIKYGCVRFFAGLFKKVVVADNLGLIVSSYYRAPASFSSFGITLTVIMLYGLQIYFDFSGYSDMAVGSARIFGIELCENFDTPYLAGSFGGLWSRWHVSLTSWFRDYIYIPLGGSRKGFLRKLLNIVIVFLISGFWHGASFTFLAWGLLNGLYRVAEEVVSRLRGISGRRENKAFTVGAVVKTCLVFLMSSLAFVFFRSTSIGEAFEVLGYLPRFKGLGFEVEGLFSLVISSFGGGAYAKLTAVLTAASLAAAILLDIKQYRTSKSEAGRYNPLLLQRPVVRRAAYVAFYLIIISIGVFGTSGFIYNNF